MAVLIAVLLLDGSLHAQEFPSQFWHKGTLVTTDGDTLEGHIKYDLTRDLAQVDINQRILTFGAKKIIYFEIFDITTDNFRQFYSLPYATSDSYRTNLLFEVVYEGQLSLLCRERIEQQTSNYNNYYYSGGTYIRDVLIYDYYFLTSNGQIEYYNQKRKELLNVMKSRFQDIKKYLKEHNLRTDEKGDLARLTAFYNGLIES